LAELPTPVLLELDWGEIAQGGMNAFLVVNRVDKFPQLMKRILKVDILGHLNFVEFDRANDALSLAVLPGFADGGHTDFDVAV
jgi:hypothetical protein